MIAVAEMYVVGKNKEKSKTGKNCYTFLNGNVSNDPKALVDKCTTISWWTDRDLDLVFMQAVKARVEISGDFINVLDVVQ